MFRLFLLLTILTVLQQVAPVSSTVLKFDNTIIQNYINYFVKSGIHSFDIDLVSSEKINLMIIDETQWSNYLAGKQYFVGSIPRYDQTKNIFGSTQKLDYDQDFYLVIENTSWLFMAYVNGTINIYDYSKPESPSAESLPWFPVWVWITIGIVGVFSFIAGVTYLSAKCYKKRKEFYTMVALEEMKSDHK